MTLSALVLIGGCLLAGAAALLPLRRPIFAIALAGWATGWALAGIWTQVTPSQAGFQVSAAIGSFLGVVLLRRVAESRRTAVRLLAAEIDARQANGARRVTEERARIARDVHDMLAHSLSAQLVQIRVARSHLAHKRIREADLVLERSEASVRDSLIEVRETVSAIRGPGIGLAALRAQALRWAEISGRTITLNLPDVEPDLPVEHWGVLEAAVRESLTNTLRHSNSQRVEVELRTVGDAILTVSDFEPADAPIAGQGYSVPAGGVGLRGLEERVHEVGGELSTGGVGTGFRVSITLPRPGTT